MKSNRIIFHLDVCSAYLSYQAAYDLQHGSQVDIRDLCSVVGGSEANRNGIVLAKSKRAKAYGVQTGEPLFSARQKCAAQGEKLVVIPPNFSVYISCSNAMLEILQSYTPLVQRFSIDECWIDVSGMEYYYPDPVKLGHDIKDRIMRDCGFEVSVGISENKLLAKMASDMKKGVTTLYPNEIKEKMWPLPVDSLFYCGSKSKEKLWRYFGIETIGQLAQFDLNLLKNKLKSHGEILYLYANGIEDSPVRKSNFINMKGMGNSTTSAWDIENREEAHLFILSLCETIGSRLRYSENLCNLVSVNIRYSDFRSFSKQRKFDAATDITTSIHKEACRIFDELWDGTPIRHLGVNVSHLSSNEYNQVTLFDEKDTEKKKSLDKAIDKIRAKYGSKSIMRTCFLDSGIHPMMGGSTSENYPVMTSIL